MADEINNEEVTEVNEQQPTAEEPENNPDVTEEKTFTQSDVDKMIKDRLARADKKKEQAIQKEREESDRKKLEEQEEYKALAETYKEELAAMKASALEAKKDSLLVKAGYGEDKIERLRKYVSGNNEEEIEESITQLKEDIPPAPQYVDPSMMMNGAKDKPEHADPTEIGVSAWERIKHRVSK